MSLLLAFAVIMIAGVTADVLISMEVEKHFQPAGLPTFFVMLVALIIGGWRLAIRLTEPRTDTPQPKNSA